ncbi:MAG: hypothetical protein DHS20C14_18150 [Phycisphaeraceae bacterium]|nr:MAG: hypothetical protein DHS20C14_18150 [Phycisphaeraceae bacterium]
MTRTQTNHPETSDRFERSPDAPRPDADSDAPADAPQPDDIGGRKKKRKLTLFERIEAFASRLSTRNNFWHRVCSMIWLPYAFKSGITMKKLDGQTFSATLPFRRFNKNWYNAMAGAALLGNAEIAGGSYVFQFCGADYTVVCKHLDYKFLRPCFGPAEYRITPRDDVEALIAEGGEFNINVIMNVVQVLPTPKPKDPDRNVKPGRLNVGREKRVGRVNATFHVTPKAHHKEKKARKANA